MTAPAPPNDRPQAPGKNYLSLFVASMVGIRWSYALIAFMLAVTLWYTVTVRDKVETWVDVQVQFKDAPSNLVITEGLVNKVSVRVLVARGLSRGLTGREAMVVNLSGIVRGRNAITISRDMLPFTSAYEVVEVSPPGILVVADAIATREIELGSFFEGKLAADLFVKSIRFTPQKVEAKGAETLLSGIPKVRIPIPLTSDMPKGTTNLTVAAPVPANVSVTPPQVGIDIEIGVRTKQVKVVRDITVTGYADGHNPEIVPAKVTIVADMPESLSGNKDILNVITATVALPPDIAQQARKLPVTVALPDNTELVSVTPAEVTVSIPEQ